MVAFIESYGWKYERLIGLPLFGRHLPELVQQTRREPDGDQLFGHAAGRLPTLRMHLHCSSVASGISEKSICESGLCLTFLPARLPCADNPDRFFFMLRRPQSIDDKYQPFGH